MFWCIRFETTIYVRGNNNNTEYSYIVREKYSHRCFDITCVVCTFRQTGVLFFIFYVLLLFSCFSSFCERDLYDRRNIFYKTWNLWSLINFLICQNISRKLIDILLYAFSEFSNVNRNVPKTRTSAFFLLLPTIYKTIIIIIFFISTIPLLNMNVLR